MKTISLMIKMLSDWHIGSGIGKPPVIDSAVATDPRDNLPYIGGKTLLGVWRDACEEWLQTKDCHKNWFDWVDYLFGSQPNQLRVQGSVEYSRPIEAALKIGDARLPKEVRGYLYDSPWLIKHLFSTRRCTSIGDNGQALDDSLRTIEYVRGDLELVADYIEIPEELDGKQKLTAVALLACSCQWIERLGGKRRRAAGLTRWSITGTEYSAKELLSAMREAEPVAPPYHTSVNVLRNHKFDDVKPYPDLVGASTIVIGLESPVVVPKQILGNIFKGEECIPGRYLLGVLMNRLATILPDKNWLQLFASGNAKVTFAYPLVKSQRLLPTPYCLYKEKMEANGLDKGATVYNRIWHGLPDQQIKQLRHGFVSPHEKDMYFPMQPVQVKAIHNQVDDETQRPSASGGAVYVYEALAPRQNYCCDLYLPQDILDELDKISDWRGALSGSAAIGVSRHSQYGRVLLDCSDYQCVDREIPQDAHYVIWFVSPAIFRNSDLSSGFSVARVLEEIRKFVPSAKLRDSQGLLMDFACRTERLSSWNRSWGLPRPTQVAVSAGSCLVIEVDNTLDNLRSIEKMQALGLGELTGQGYGEINCFSTMMRSALGVKFSSELVSFDGTSISNSKQNLLLEGMWENYWLEQFKANTALYVHDQDFRKSKLGWVVDSSKNDSRPSTTQLSSLREIVTRTLRYRDREDWVNVASSWMSSRSENWPKLAKRFLVVVMGGNSSSDDFWDWFDEHVCSTQQWCQNERRRSELRRKTWATAVRYFVVSAVRFHFIDCQQAKKRKQHDPSDQ